MLHPSYTDLMKVVNSDVEPGETKIVRQPLLHRYGDFQKSKADHRRR